jgi:hypothetical protein
MHLLLQHPPVAVASLAAFSSAFTSSLMTMLLLEVPCTHSNMQHRTAWNSKHSCSQVREVKACRL